MRTFVSISLVVWSAIISLSCIEPPFSPENSVPAIKIELRDAGSSSVDGWLAKLVGDKIALPNDSRMSSRLAKQTAIDEAKILVIDLTLWDSESEFRGAWETMNQTALLDTSNWDDQQDFWTNVVALFQSYTGDTYRFSGEFNLEIVGGSATGDISAPPGLNYFVVALRNSAVTRFWDETFFIVADGQENNICFGCGPDVQIDSPTEGMVFTTNVITVSGMVSDDTLKTATLIVNGFPQIIPVNNRAFSNQIVLSVGTNTILVEASNADGLGADSVKVEFQGQRAALRATLVWDTDRTDMDLRMVNPSGEECSFQNPNIGGMILDVDDADGFGPENISVVQPDSGNYRVRVVNFSASEGMVTTVTLYVFKNEVIDSTLSHTFDEGEPNVPEVVVAWPD